MFQKLWHMLNFQTWRSKVTLKVTRSNFWYEWKGLIIMNAHVKYESPTSNGSKVMGKVKVFVTDGKTDGRTEGQTDRQMRFNVPSLSRKRGTKMWCDTLL